MKDLSFWYYTLSAIPQTLAGIIAFFFGFVIYRLSRINELIDQSKSEIEEQDHGFFDKFPELPRGRWTAERELVNIIKKGLPEKAINFESDKGRFKKIQDCFNVLETRVDKKESIFWYMNINLFFMGPAIIVPLLILPFGSVFKSCLLWTILIPVVILGLLAVGWAILSVYNISWDNSKK